MTDSDHENEMELGQPGVGDDAESSSEFEDSDSASGSESDPGTPSCVDVPEAFEEDEVDEDDPVVKAIRSAKDKKTSHTPPPILSKGSVFDFSFHPELDLIAVSSDDADIELLEYTNEAHTSKQKTMTVDPINRTYVRALRFNHDATRILLLKSDGDLSTYNMEGLQLEQTLKVPSKSGPIRLHVVDENITAIGDEDGGVKLWDKRKKDNAMSLQVSGGGITGLLSDENKQTLVCCTNDGYLASIKIRGGRIDVKSEQYESPFHCLGTFRQNSKLAVGDSDGQVYFFNWGEFGYHCDVYSSGKENEISAMLPITEKIGLLGDEQGYVRAVHFYPHKNLGVVGKHRFGVEVMDVCNDGHLIASSDLNHKIDFWNVSYLSGFQIPVDQIKKSGKMKKEMKKHNLPSSNETNPSSFFDGLKD